MDWIDEQLDKIKNRMKIGSLKRVLCVYIVITIFTVFAMYILTFLYCESWKLVVYEKYIADTKEADALVDIERLELKNSREMEIINGIQNYSIIIPELFMIIH